MSFPTTGILDAFTRADATPLDGSWANGWWGCYDLVLVSNAVRGRTPGWCGARYTGGTYGPDCEAYVTVTDVGLGGGSLQFELALRVSDSSDTFDGYTLTYQMSGSDSQLSRVDDGVNTQLGSRFAVSVAAGDRLGLEAVGSTLTVYKYTGGSWASVASRTDATYGSAGYLAMDHSRGDTHVPVFDDFGGGTVVGGGSTVSRTTGQSATLSTRWGVPEADISVGGWTTAPLYAKIDES